MELLKARTVAEGIVSQLRPYCERIEIAGSIRRQRPNVNDIDLLLIPSNLGKLGYELEEMGGMIKLKGNKLIRCRLTFITVDIYFATPETWGTLLLIRTGSAAHNIKLAKLAKARGMKLHADGSGITRNGERIAGDTEESIFAALGLPYILPAKREVVSYDR